MRSSDLDAREGQGTAPHVPEGARFLFVTVGTEHYPFRRLIWWVDAWLEAREDPSVRCVVQYGASEPPRIAEGQPFFSFEAMLDLNRRADAVVCHGGTGSVMLARHAGKRPIVVPRLHALGEHVDDHQVRFARWMAARGEVELAETEEQFRRILDEIPRKRRMERTRPDPRVELAVARAGALIDSLLHTVER